MVQNACTGVHPEWDSLVACAAAMEAHTELSIAASKASFGGPSEEDSTAKDFAIAIATHIGREHMLTSSRISRQVSPLGSTQLNPVAQLQVMTGQL